MSGIQSLLGSGAKTFGIDKLSENLPPQMRELLPFAMNPQGYLVGKAVNSIADYLGYGNEVKDLQADAKAEKDYFKETIRDAIGDVLPNTVGDFVRATPRVEEPYDPYNGYFAQNINDWVSTRDSTPESIDNFENFVRNENYGTQTPGTGKAVGPLPEDNPIFESNVSNLPYELKSTPVSGAPDNFDPALLAAIIRGNYETPSDTGPQLDPASTPAGSGFVPIDFGGTMDYSDDFGKYGLGVSDFGGGGRFDSEYYKSANAMANGGFITEVPDNAKRK
jgi:hypothetical protein